MSKDTIEVELKQRDIIGKGLGKLRTMGQVPGVIHNHGKESRVVMAPYVDMVKVYQRAGKHTPLELTVGKDKYFAIIKDVDFEPKKHQLRHVVFNSIKQNEKVHTEVPIHLEGEIPAEKAGLMVITQLDTINIEALPKDLVDELSVDATSLIEIGNKITVADIEAPKGVTILTEAEHPIATVEETKAQMSEEAAEETETTEESAEEE